MNKDTKKSNAYSFEQLISSKKYSTNADLLTAILEKDKLYTTDEIDKIIKKFLEGGAY